MFELSLEGLEGAVVAAQPPPLLSGSIQGTWPPGEASLCSAGLCSCYLLTDLVVAQASGVVFEEQAPHGIGAASEGT